MKTRDEIDRRLEKLRSRYLRQHVSASQTRRPCNCVHNHEHVPTAPPRRSHTSSDIAPRKTTTLVVLRETQTSIRLCMYGSEDIQNWPGDVCDTDDTARACPYFRPRVSQDAAVEEFRGLLADDKHVLQTYPDVAALQWVLDSRVHDVPQPWHERVRTWWSKLFARTPKALPAPATPDAEPDGLWDGSEAEPRNEA